MSTLRNKITEYLTEIHGQKKEIWDTTISEFVYIMGILSDLKKDVKDIVTNELKRIAEDPGLAHLTKK